MFQVFFLQNYSIALGYTILSSKCVSILYVDIMLLFNIVVSITCLYLG